MDVITLICFSVIFLTGMCTPLLLSLSGANQWRINRMLKDLRKKCKKLNLEMTENTGHPIIKYNDDDIHLYLRITDYKRISVGFLIRKTTGEIVDEVNSDGLIYASYCVLRQKKEMVFTFDNYQCTSYCMYCHFDTMSSKYILQELYAFSDSAKSFMKELYEIARASKHIYPVKVSNSKRKVGFVN